MESGDETLNVLPILIPRVRRRKGVPMPGTDDERFEAIQRRAYEISQQPDSGSESDNWARAERELTRGSSLQTEGERALGTHE